LLALHSNSILIKKTVHSVRNLQPVAPRNQMSKVAPEASSNGKGEIKQQRKKADDKPEVARRPTDETSADEATLPSKAADKSAEASMLTSTQKLAVAQVLFARYLHCLPHNTRPHNPTRALPHPLHLSCSGACAPPSQQAYRPTPTSLPLTFTGPLFSTRML